MNTMTPTERLEHVETACTLLKLAQSCLREAGANKAATKVARARKSADGARRNAQRFLVEAVIVREMATAYNKEPRR